MYGDVCAFADIYQGIYDVKARTLVSYCLVIAAVSLRFVTIHNTDAVCVHASNRLVISTFVSDLKEQSK